jgi:ABC-type sugar transport systems, permease components
MPENIISSPIKPDNGTLARTSSRLIPFRKKDRREAITGWLFVLPALVMYSIFVLLPLLLSIHYSFFRWDGITPMTWVGLKNYKTVFEVPDLLNTIVNAFKLVLFFSFIPVGLGLVVASVIHRVAPGRLGSIARTVLFLPQSSRWWQPGSSGVGCWLCQINQPDSKSCRSGNNYQAWLGDFDWALRVA